MKYSIEQKIVLVKKLELYRLEKNLSYTKLAKVIGTYSVNIHHWESCETLPTSKLCYQIELLTANWEPALYKERLNADYLQTCIDSYKTFKAKREFARKQKLENKINSGNN